MRISVSVGEYAKVPYCVPGIERNVYCVEELCYCIRENAFLLDLTFLDDGLLDWLGRECGLLELSRALYPMVHRKGSLSSFATAILKYVGLYDEGAVQETEQVLKQGAGLSAIEKRKAQVDHLVGKKKYSEALKGYDALLEKWQEQSAAGAALPAPSTLSAIWHNRGVALAGLMNYERAAECFLRALELDGAPESRAGYLAAVRMGMPEDEYVTFIAEHGELYQDSLELEKKLEQSAALWEQQPDYLLLYNRRERRESDRVKYLEESGHLAQALKDSYRSAKE